MARVQTRLSRHAAAVFHAPDQGMHLHRQHGTRGKRLRLSAHVNPESPHLGHQVCDGSHRSPLQMSQAMSPTNPMHKVNSTGLLQSGSYVSDLENEANVYLELPWIPWIPRSKEIWSELIQSSHSRLLINKGENSRLKWFCSIFTKTFNNIYS